MARSWDERLRIGDVRMGVPSSDGRGNTGKGSGGGSGAVLGPEHPICPGKAVVQRREPVRRAWLQGQKERGHPESLAFVVCGSEKFVA